MQLLHHFSTVTYATLDTIESQAHLWQGAVVKLGFDHPFLLQSILAISALHKSTGSPSPARLKETAIRYHDVALVAFRRALLEVNEDNVSALFAASCLTVVYEFGVGGQDNPGKAIDDMVSCIRLVQGVTSIIAPFHQNLEESSLGPVLQNGFTPTCNGHVTEILQLHELVDEQYDQERRSVYLEAIDVVHSSFITTVGQINLDQSAIGSVLVWPATLPKLFIEQILDRDNVTLVILAYYAVLFHLRRQCWWLRGWYDNLIREIESELTPEYQRWVMWPKQIRERSFVQI